MFARASISCIALFVMVSVSVAAQTTTISAPIPDDVWKRMQGKSWHPNIGCPAREQLAFLKVPYHDFSGAEKVGEMVVGKEVATTVAEIFNEIYKTPFRIQSIRLVDDFGGNDDLSMAANNTSAFNCRKVTGGTSLSAHAFGQAIDINPVQNPYVRGKRTEPAKGMKFDEPKERNRDVIGLITADGPVVKIFTSKKWTWGGNFRKLKDYQHFSSDGR